MRVIIGLGEAGCNIADQFAKYPQYRIYKIDVGLESFEDLVIDVGQDERIKNFAMQIQQTSEDYEKNCPPMDKFFKDIRDDDEVLFIAGGGGKIMGASLRVLETIKNSKLSVMYVKPDLELIGGKKYILDRISYYVLQEYARSGMFERIYLVYNPSLEEMIGDVPVKGYFDKLNETLVQVVHNINSCKQLKPVFENRSDPEDHVRVSTIGTVHAETGVERMLFPLSDTTDKIFYIGVGKEVLENGEFFKQLKINMKKKAELENVSVSYVINETPHENSYVYVVAHTDEIQQEDNIIRSRNPKEE